MKKLLLALMIVVGSVSVYAQEDKYYMSLEDALENKDKVYVLYLSGYEITSLPETIGNLSNLRELNLNETQVARLPESIGNLTNLQTLNLVGNKFTSLPESIGQLRNLNSINLSNNQLTNLPDGIVKLSNLKFLDLSYNPLIGLPLDIETLHNLEINLAIINSVELLNDIARIEDAGISIQWDYSDKLWNEIETANPYTNISAAQEFPMKVIGLDLSNQNFGEIPDDISKFHFLALLNLSGNQLSTLPESIGELKDLLVLVLSGNQLTSLPETIGNLTDLQILSLSENQLTSLPESIGNLTNLQGLSLDYNQLTSLPDWIGNLTNLQSLTLRGNHITRLPESIGNLYDLKKIWMSDKSLTESDKEAIKQVLPTYCEIRFFSLDLKAQIEKEQGINDLLKTTVTNELLTKELERQKQYLPRDMPPDLMLLFIDLLLAEVDISEIRNLIIPTYDAAFFYEEIKELTKFYQSPSGEKMIRVQSKLEFDNHTFLENYIKENLESIVLTGIEIFKQGNNTNSPSKEAASQSNKTEDIGKLLRINNTEIRLKELVNNILEGPSWDFSNYIRMMNKDYLKRYFWTGLKYNEIYNPIVASYDQYYSHDEIKSMIAFYESPVGQKLINTDQKLKLETLSAFQNHINIKIHGFENKLQKKELQAREYADSLVNFHFFDEFLNDRYMDRREDITDIFNNSHMDIEDLFFKISINTDIKGVRRVMDSAINTYPFSEIFYGYRAFIAQAMGDYNTAIKDFTTVYEFLKDYKEGVYYYYLAARLKFESGDYKEGIKDLMTLTVQSPELWFESGAVELGPTITHLLESETASKEANYLLATVKLAKALTFNDPQLYTLALEFLKNAVNIDSEFTIAITLSMQINHRLLNYSKVIEDCDKLIAINPKVAEVYAYRANAKLELGDNMGAVNDCSRFFEFYVPNYERNVEVGPLQAFSSNKDPYEAVYDILARSKLRLSIDDFKITNTGSREEMQIKDFESLRPLNNEMLFGLIKWKSDQYKEAVEHYFYGLRENLYYLLSTQKIDYFPAEVQSQLIALDINEMGKNGYFVKALTKIHLQDYESSIQDLDAFIQSYPDSDYIVQAVYLKSICLERLGEYEDLIKSYNKLIDLNLDLSEDLLLPRAEAKAKIGNFNGAIADCEKRLEISHYDQEAHLLKVELLMQSGDFNDAMETICQLIEVAEEQYWRRANEILYRRAIMYLQAGNYEKALVDYEKILISETSASRGGISFDASRMYPIIDSISRDLEKIIRANPQMEKAYELCGTANYIIGDYQGALENYIQQQSVFKNSPAAYYGQGLAKSYLKDYKGAVKDFDKAIKLDPDFFRAYYYRGEIKSKMGNHDAACSDWNTFRELYNQTDKSFIVSQFYCY